MKKVLTIVSIIAFMFVTTCCSSFSRLNAITDGTSLGSANFEYVRSVEETASTTYIIGFGGGTPETRAIHKLKNTANLQPNQTLTNYSVVTTHRIICGIVRIKTVTATADIVQFK